MEDAARTAEQRMEQYLENLENENYDEAAAQFTEEAHYYHPLLEAPIRGREAIADFFALNRDPRDRSEGVDHKFSTWVVDGDAFGVLGEIDGSRGETMFVAYGELSDGKISYYTPGLVDNIW